MKRIILLTFSLLFFIAMSMPALALEQGEMPPMADQMMKGVDGKDYSLNSVKGENGTLVMFSCNTCPWVIAWEDRIAKIGNDYMSKGFGVIVINSNDPVKKPGDGYEAMKEYAAKCGYNFPYVSDAGSKVATAFGATHTPEVYLFNAKNELVYQGAIDDNAENAAAVKEPYLINAMNAVASGKMVAAPQTKAMGCSIKFPQMGS